MIKSIIVHKTHEKFLKYYGIGYKIETLGEIEVVKLTPGSPNHFCSWREYQIIVAHYTASSFSSTIHTFMNKNSVSAHFVIDIDGTIFNLVNLSQRAYHATKCSWKNYHNIINCLSIGIELVNHGFKKSLLWQEFTPFQIRSCAKLMQYLSKKYNISNENIVGHSDLTVNKVDPGPMFPWYELYKEYNIGNWAHHHISNVESSIKFLLNELKKYGYRITNDHNKNMLIIKNFRMHFVDNLKPENLDINIYDSKKLLECCKFAASLNYGK